MNGFCRFLAGLPGSFEFRLRVPLTHDASDGAAAAARIVDRTTQTRAHARGQLERGRCRGQERSTPAPHRER